MRKEKTFQTVLLHQSEDKKSEFKKLYKTEENSVYYISKKIGACLAHVATQVEHK